MSNLDWISLLWPMIAAASLTLGAVHLVVWLRQGNAANLLFGLTAAAVATTSVFELFLMRAQTPVQYEAIVRWAHVPVAIVVLGIVGFVLVHFRTSNYFLAAATCLTRVACLVPNFMAGANLNFAAVNSLHTLSLGPAAMEVPLDAVPGAWRMLGHVNLILLALFLASAIVEVWRRGPSPERHSVMRVCGSMLFFVALAGVWNWAVVQGRVQGPLVVSPAFLCVLLVMGYELGSDLLRARQLARHLGATQRTLHDMQRRADQVVDAAEIGLWNLDVATGDAWLSNRAMQILGIEPRRRFRLAQMIRRVHPEDRRVVDGALSAAARANGNFGCECRVVHSNGTIRWIATHGQVQFDEAGSPGSMDGILIDLTEHKSAQERLRLVIETVPMAMLVVDPEGAIVLANQQAEVLLGVPRARLAGLAVDRFISTAFRSGRMEGRVNSGASSSQHAHALGLDLFVVRDDETEVPVEIASNPIAMADASFVLMSLVDLTERKRMESESALQRTELAHLSRVSMLVELSGSLAHELNQPLSAILSNAQAAIRFLDHAPPNLDEVRDGLVNIVEGDKRAGEIIRRMRALLRKESPEHRPLDINDVVMDVLRLIHSDLLGRRVDLVLEIAEELPPVHGDKVQLQQVLLNLIMNASEAMKDTSRRRTLSVMTGKASADMVEVSVSDVGSGIKGEDLEHVFTPFVTTKRDGLGLGLTVCRTIIHAHDGRLRAINNSAGPGATFSFTLPFAHANPETAPSPSA